MIADPEPGSADHLLKLAEATKAGNADNRCDAVLVLVRMGAAKRISPSAIFARAYDDPDGHQFWEDSFSTRLSLDKLIRLIETPLGVPSRPRPLPAELPQEKRDELNRQIEISRCRGPLPASFPTMKIRAALAQAPATLLNAENGRVEARPLLEWLLNSRHRDLVHSSLRQFLAHEVELPPCADAAVPPLVTDSAPVRQITAQPPSKRGRKRTVKSEVIAAMRKLDREDLDTMLEKEMVDRFGGCRTTCREARKEVLAEARS